MSNVTFHPFAPQGTVAAPPSKSDVHRAIICAALSGGVSTVSPVALSEDITATIRCVEALGAVTAMEDGRLTVERYWEIKFDPDEKPDLEQWVNRISDTFKNSVAAHKTFAAAV